jgi:hypothetical protein
MTAAESRSSYFLITHLVLLVVVLLAFTPTFFLRSSIPQPPILDMSALPGLFVVHGIILIVWYALLVLQPALVRSGNIPMHRRTGLFGVFLALAVLVSTVMMVHQFPGRMHAMSAERGIPVVELEPGLNMILWLDLFMILLFIGYLSAGIVNRNRPQVHKRCMLFAATSLAFAAIGRLGGIVSDLLDMQIGMVLGLIFLLGITASLLLHDRRTAKRIHSTSWLCFATYWLATILSMVAGAIDEEERLSAFLIAL